MELIILSPLSQFEVFSLIGINSPLLGFFNINLTNLGIYSILILLCTVSLHYFGSSTKIIPNKWSISLESLNASVSSIVKEQIGSKSEIYLPFIYSIFLFILIGNLKSNVPYSFAVTASAVVTLGFSFTTLLGVTILGIYKHKIHFFSLFVPAGTSLGLVPLLVLIELISYLARGVSLGVRLFANLVGGHILLKTIAGFLIKLFSISYLIGLLTLIPFLLFLALIGLELAVAIIQAFVFTILMCSYLKDSIQLHASQNKLTVKKKN